MRETSKLLEEVNSLKRTNKQLQQSLHQSQLDLDELEQYGRRMCLDISGIKGDTGNPSENVKAKVIDMLAKANVALKATDIDRCHRKGRRTNGKNRKVIIKFTNSDARQLVYQKRKQLGPSIYVQENLTRFREGLSYEARQQVRAKTLTKTWIAGCRVFVTVPGDSKPLLITSETDLQNAIKPVHV